MQTKPTQSHTGQSNTPAMFPKKLARQGFSLLEALVALTVLSISLGVFFDQLQQHSSTSIRITERTQAINWLHNYLHIMQIQAEHQIPAETELNYQTLANTVAKQERINKTEKLFNHALKNYQWRLQEEHRQLEQPHHYGVSLVVSNAHGKVAKLTGTYIDLSR